MQVWHISIWSCLLIHAGVLAALASGMRERPQWVACFKVARPLCVTEAMEQSIKQAFKALANDKLLQPAVLLKLRDLFDLGKVTNLEHA